MKALAVVFTHWASEAFMPFYEWHNERIENLRYVWDVTDHTPEEIGEVNNPNIMPMKLNNLRANLINNYYPMCLNWFQKEDPDYFVLMESDLVIGTHDFIEKNIEYMEHHRIEALFPWLCSAVSNPEHPFAQSLNSVQPKLWTIPGMVIISKKALDIYGQTLRHSPMYWCEIRFPSELAKYSVIVGSSPYSSDVSIHCGHGNGEERKNWSLPDEEIENSVNLGLEAFHPIKTAERLDFIKEKLDEKNTLKETVSK